MPLDNFYDLLFEVSNEDRHSILLQLEKEPMSVTQIARTLHLSLPETSRHVSRLGDVGLMWKDSDGQHHLTHFGELVLKQLREMEFSSEHSEYFTGHTTGSFPPEFVKRIGDLVDSTRVQNVMNFLHSVENLIRDAEEYVWFQCDEYTMSTLPLIEEALDRGVEFRIIEPENYAPSEGIITVSPKELSIVSRPTSQSLMKMTLESVDVFLYVSEKMAAVALPTGSGKFDYLGFTATDSRSIRWCSDLFLHYWEQARPKTYAPVIEYRRPSAKPPEPVSLGKIILEGANDPKVDLRALQDAVDNYDEVVLRGNFNLGLDGIVITKSCVLRGEGIDCGIPLTKVYNNCWQVPTTNESLITCSGGDTEVVIENIHFTEFKGRCMACYGGNRLTIRNNRITIPTGVKLGLRMTYGDMIIGIWVSNRSSGQVDNRYPGGVVIEGNHLDFALSHLQGGHVSPGNIWDDPEYRPDLFDEYYIGMGIGVINVGGEVLIQDNTVRNTNSVGVSVADCMTSANVKIRSNEIVSEIYGAHPLGWPESGVGISLHSAQGRPNRSGFEFEVSGNKIRCRKRLYGGINVSGPFNAPEGSGKFTGGVVKENSVHLENGAVGIKVGRSDHVKVAGNVLTGRAYYGLRVHGRGYAGDVTMYAEGNAFKDNDMDGLEIKDPDSYSDSQADGLIFKGSPEGSTTANIWLDTHSRDNSVEVKPEETVIDEGEGNRTERLEAP
ncbi:MAG: right-handed parallel beta-helix repeat-containing protein [Candidatus Bathyarchaeota archaeon]|nr:MAG: right-handed parallel beta-helix repeat-containing protein [Candidatus Bathyarchaeota archaeon]